MFYNDPIEFESFITPIAGPVIIRPAIGASFNAEICIKRLEHVGLFTVAANSFKVEKEPQQNFYGLTIPLSASFAVSESDKNQVYEPTSAHLLSPDQPFNLTSKRKCNLLVSNFFVDPVSDYSRKLLQSDLAGQASLNSKVSFFTQAGSILLRSVAQMWTALNNKMSVSDIILKELEDDLFASFVLYAYENTNAGKPYKHDDPYHLSRAEDYISDNLQNPITRDQLAGVSGRSIRTLSRAFEKKYGIGPMAFIKQRRLDAAYLDLLSARPGSCSVTQVAFSYGFSHVGKFAVEYRKAFGETPSTSLVK